MKFTIFSGFYRKKIFQNYFIWPSKTLCNTPKIIFHIFLIFIPYTYGSYFCYCWKTVLSAVQFSTTEKKFENFVEHTLLTHLKLGKSRWGFCFSQYSHNSRSPDIKHTVIFITRLKTLRGWCVLCVVCLCVCVFTL